MKPETIKFDDFRMVDPQAVIDSLVAQTKRQAEGIHKLNQEIEAMRETIHKQGQELAVFRGNAPPGPRKSKAVVFTEIPQRKPAEPAVHSAIDYADSKGREESPEKKRAKVQKQKHRQREFLPRSVTTMPPPGGITYDPINPPFDWP